MLDTATFKQVASMIIKELDEVESGLGRLALNYSTALVEYVERRGTKDAVLEALNKLPIMTAMPEPAARLMGDLFKLAITYQLSA